MNNINNDLISRQQAIDGKISIQRANGVEIYTDEAVLVEHLKNVPAADVAPVVHGRWLPIVSYNNTYKCSECGRLLVDITDGLKMVAKQYPYCHCGAKMDGERKESAYEI